MLYSTDELRRDFADYEPLLLQQTETVLEEGLYHQGLSSVVQYLGRKPLA